MACDAFLGISLGGYLAMFVCRQIRRTRLRFDPGRDPQQSRISSQPTACYISGERITFTHGSLHT